MCSAQSLTHKRPRQIIGFWEDPVQVAAAASTTAYVATTEANAVRPEVWPEGLKPNRRRSGHSDEF